MISTNIKSKKKFLELIHSKYNLYIILPVLLSFLFFRGRLGSDDLEVFNFALGLFKSELSFFDYLHLVTQEKLNFYNQDQVPTYLTFSHRMIWILQTYIIVNFLSLFNSFFDNADFIAQYFSGYILSLYTILSFFIFYKSLLNKNIELSSSFFITFAIFFGTGLISFFSGSYIECLILLLFTIRNSITEKKKLIVDFIIILIKPYYIFIILTLRYLDIPNNTLNIKNILKIILPGIMWLIIRAALFDFEYNAGYAKTFDNFRPTLSEYQKNLFDILFSFSYGFFFSNIIPLILIFCGYNKFTKFKIFGLIFLILFLALFEWNHGAAPGGRYIMPTIVIFLEEYSKGFGVIKIKFKKIILLIFAFTLVNLPVLEYRNMNFPQYYHGSVFVGKSINPTIDFQIFNYPLRNLDFHHTVFANRVILCQIFNCDYLKVGEYKLTIKNIYPMTPILRLAFLKKNNIKVFEERIINKVNKYLNIFLLIYLIFFSIIIMLFTYSLKQLIKK
jgi:hypothetical protein